MDKKPMKFKEILQFMEDQAEKAMGVTTGYMRSPDIAKMLRDIRGRLETAYKAEFESRVDPTEYWKRVCALCSDGEIEPDCMYYGDPNGCNSPTYHRHPVTPYGDPARLRKALENVMPLLRCYIRKTPATTILTDVEGEQKTIDIRKAYDDAVSALEDGGYDE